MHCIYVIYDVVGCIIRTGDLEFNPLMRADILARAQIQTWKIPFKTKY